MRTRYASGSRTVHARAVPLWPAGGVAYRRTRSPPHARRGARDRAEPGTPTAPRLDPPAGVHALSPAAVPAVGQDRLSEVARALLSGRLVSVLGPGPPSQNGNELHAQLATAFDCPEEHRGNLSRVSQYVAVTHGVGPLYDRAARALLRGGGAGARRVLPRSVSGSRPRERRRSSADRHDRLRPRPRARIRGDGRGCRRRLVCGPGTRPREVPSPRSRRQ